MKSHEKKIHEKQAHEAELERNDLYAWGQNLWTRLKNGDLISRKFALYTLAVGAAIGLVFYLVRGNRTNESAAWRNLENTSGLEALNKFAADAPNTTPGRIARMQVARQMLGPLGVGQLSNIDPNTRSKAIRNIEDARESFTKLADEFKDDLTLQAQAIDGAAHAELALIGIPKEGTSLASSDYRGTVDKAIELFRRYAKLVGEEAGEPAKKMADELEARKSDVVQLGFYINTKMAPLIQQPKIDAPPSLTPFPAGPIPPK